MSAQIIFIGEIQRQCKFALIACDAMQKSLHQMGQEIDKEKQLVIKIEKCQEGLLLLLSVVDSFNIQTTIVALKIGLIMHTVMHTFFECYHCHY